MALGLVLGGCYGEPDDLEPPVQETSGLLGHGVFRWLCVGDADPICGSGTFPTLVALNAQFQLGFTPDTDLPRELDFFSLDSVSPLRLSETNETFETLRVGDVSVVALADGLAVDYVQLTVRPVDDLELGIPESSLPCDDDYDQDGVCDGSGGVVVDPPVTLVRGEVIDVRARASGGREALAGALSYEWESLAPGVVEVLDAQGRGARLFVVGMGMARISVTAGGYTEVFEYEVQEPSPEEGSSGTEGESDGSGTEAGSGGADSGTEGDTGSGSDTGSESESDTGSESGTSGETDGATTTGGMQ